jgi:hypothetical protein
VAAGVVLWLVAPDLLVLGALLLALAVGAVLLPNRPEEAARMAVESDDPMVRKAYELQEAPNWRWPWY